MLNIYIYIHMCVCVCDTPHLSLLQFDDDCQDLQTADGGDDLLDQLLQYLDVLVSEPS